MLLDNFEHVLPAALAVSRLLTVADELKVLATSRAPLRLIMEYEYPVPPLTLPDLRHLPLLSALSQYEAIDLFVQRSLAVQPSFALTDACAPAVAALCTHLDGLPLAIELAAAASRTLSPAALLEQISHGLRFLADGPRDLPARQQTLHSAIQWSYDLLPPRAQRVIRRLAVFVGGWTAPAAVAVSGSAVSDAMLLLVDHNLVQQREQPDGTVRFTMLETVREFALERLEESSEAAATRERHAAYFVAFTEEAEPHFFRREQVEWLDRVQCELDNLRAVWQWSAGNDRAEPGLRILNAITRLIVLRSYDSEAIRWFERLLALPSAQAPTAVRARSLSHVSARVYDDGWNEPAIELAEEALRISRSIGSPAEAAFALHKIFMPLRLLDPPKAVPILAEAMELQRQASFPELDMHLPVAAVRLAAEETDPAGTGPLLEEHLNRQRQIGERSELGRALNMQGKFEAQYRHNYAMAQQCFTEARALFEELGCSVWMPNLATLQGPAYVAAGDLDQAETLYRETLERLRDAGLHHYAGHLLALQGDVAYRRGDMTLAQAHYEESLKSLAGRHPWPAGMRAHVGLAEVGHRTNERSLQRQHVAQALLILRDGRPRPASARDTLRQAADAILDDPALAVRLLAAAERLAATAQDMSVADFMAVGASLLLSPGNPAPHEAQITALRRRLGDEAFEQAWSEGEKLEMQQALECALQAMDGSVAPAPAPDA